MKNQRKPGVCPGGHFSPIAAIDRRSFMTVGALSGLGLTLGDMLRHEARAGDVASKGGKVLKPIATNVIQIYLGGGASHLESWDPKPEAPVENRGPLGVVKTKIPGICLGETMPRLAENIDKLSIVRSIAGRIPDHNQATYHVMTGYSPSPAIQHPQMGAIISHELGTQNNLPAWIGVPRTTDVVSTGYLPSKFGCFSIGADPGQRNFQVRDVGLPKDMPAGDFEARQELRKVVEGHFRKMDTNGTAVETMDEFYRQAYSLLSSTQAQRAFKLDDEPQATQDLYGIGKQLNRGGQPFGIGNRLMLARRLVESGARFVSVQAESGWDMHARIKDGFTNAMPSLDHAIAGLLTDLDQRGMLNSTIVMVLSEFGRTPKINATAGRDHWSRCFSMMVAGGGITRGNVFGASDSTGAEPARDAVTVEDFMATVYNRLGIDSDKRLMAPGERPIDIIRGGQVIKALLA